MVAKPFGIVTALALVAGTAAAQTRQPTEALAASGEWIVDADTTACSLTREFGSANDTLVLSLRVALASRAAELRLSSSRALPLRGTGATITVLPTGQRFRFDRSTGQSTSPGIALSSPDPTFQDAFGRADALDVELAPDTRLHLATGVTQANAAALNGCIDAQLRGYGLDPATVVSIPTASLLNAARSLAYPASAQRAGQQGRVLAAIAFDAGGRPTQCRIVRSSGSAVLDDTTCEGYCRGLQLDPAPGQTRERWALAPFRWVIPH